MDKAPEKDAFLGFDQALAGALDWWREAGVTSDFVDEPVNWLANADPEPRPVAEKPPRAAPRQETHTSKAEPAAPEPVDRSGWPAELADFSPWWCSEPALAPGPATSRIPPRGRAGAKLMVVVPEPEREDSDSLLSGPQGRLLKAMLDAMGLAEDEVYLASVLPRHMPGADWEGMKGSIVAEAFGHHVSLAAPQRIAVFGVNALSLVGNGPPQGPADLQEMATQGRSVPMLAARSLAALIEHPRWKASLWRAWLDWTGQDRGRIASNRGSNDT